MGNNSNSFTITYNLNKKNVSFFNIKKDGNNLMQMYENVIIYLNQLFLINNINLNKVYKNTLLIRKEIKGIYSYSCTFENIDNGIINCSNYLTGNFPIAQTVLYCNNAISEEEIMSFIYRSVLCDLNILFILVKPEVLDIEKKKLLIQLLKELYHQMKSCLLFIYTKENKNKEVIIEIEKLPNHKKLVFRKINFNKK